MTDIVAVADTLSMTATEATTGVRITESTSAEVNGTLAVNK